MEKFHPLVREWFESTYPSPTDVQSEAWNAISSGENILVTAPTGSGKTLSAFLWVINTLISADNDSYQTSVLYISPLKALNNDIQKNLTKPIEQISELFKKRGETNRDITIAVRSGDTSQNERQKIYRKPPDILITTPESLNIMLSSRKGRDVLTGIRTVILDEIHYLAPSKRGTHLMSAVERLVFLNGEFQRIALSATVKPIEKVMDFIAGYKLIPGVGYEKRVMRHINSTVSKSYDVSVQFFGDIESTARDNYIEQLSKVCASKIAEFSSTIIFANSRRMVEKMSRFINENYREEVAYAHHGSLSREIRLEVENRLKNGDLRAIVATSSLELGIDVGDVECVILIQSPAEISSALQRIGRSNHRVGENSLGLVFPTHGADILASVIVSQLIQTKEIEPLQIPENPLDVLAQIILSMCLVETLDVETIYNRVRCSYSYNSLSKNIFNTIIEMLSGRYSGARIKELTSKIDFDKITGMVSTKDGVRYNLFSSGGTIVDRGHYSLRLKTNNKKIGELDEEFVWERAVADTFSLGVQCWRINSITHNDVFVSPTESKPGIIPFWRAESQNRSFYISEKLGLLLKKLDEMIESEEDIGSFFMNEANLDSNAALTLARYVTLQKKHTEVNLPHRYNFVIEEFADSENATDNRQILLHTMWGGKVNRPFAYALTGFWENEFGYRPEIYADNDSILIHLPDDIEIEAVIKKITPFNFRDLVIKTLEQSGYFGALFRENAARSLLLPPRGFKNRQPLWLNRLRSKKLYEVVSEFENFPVLIESYRQALNDEFDLVSLGMLLEEVHNGTIKVSHCRTTSPSPFSTEIIWNRTNKYMYDDDTPQGSSSKTKHTLIEEIARNHEKVKIPKTVFDSLDKRLKRTGEGYSDFSSISELVEHIQDRLFLLEDEFTILISTSALDLNLEKHVIITHLSDSCVKSRINSCTVIVEIENYVILEAVNLIESQWEAIS
jgi:ATP-dependent Lhr-like helicase